MRVGAATVKHSGKPASSSAMRPRPGLRSAFFRSDERRFCGFVVDSADISRKFAVEILVDGYPVKVMRAEADVYDLTTEQVGDGCYGFSCALDEALVRDSSVVEARLANLGIAVGAPIALHQPLENAPQISAPGALRWLGGLRFSGWIDH